MSILQIKPEQSLAAIEAKLELDELEAWKNNVLKVIEYPEEEYRSGKFSLPFSFFYLFLFWFLCLSFGFFVCL